MASTNTGLKQSALKLELYKRYLAECESEPRPGKLMPYDWEGVPSTIDGTWMIYFQMLADFSPELANGINQLTLNTGRVKAWAKVIDSLSDDVERMEACHEFIDALGIFSLGAPYAIKSRFLFAAAHLSHQANRNKRAAWIDDIRPDGEIDISDTDKAGAGWKRYGRFKEKLQAIGDQRYRDSTFDFRHAYNHRFSPRFVVGFTNGIVRRVLDDGKVTYGFGGQQPLKLHHVASQLVGQCEACYATFAEFQKLVAEQMKFILAE